MGKKEDFRTKNEIMRELIARNVDDLLRVGVSKDKICIVLDSAYLSADNVEFWRELELHYAQQAKKNTKINLKGREEPLGRYFPKRSFHRRIINGKIVYYAESNLNLKSYGQNRVFAIKGAKKNGEPKKKAKYFITNLRKAMPETILTHLYHTSALFKLSKSNAKPVE